jgi:hypothetical protein
MMNAKKLGFGAALAGAGVLAARSFGPKLHEHCQSMCSERCGGAARSDEPQEPAERECCSPATPDPAEVI